MRTLAFAILFSIAFAAGLPAQTTIELRPAPGLEPVAERIRQTPPERIERLFDLFGNPDGGPIIVVLAGEDSSYAQGVPPSVSGYADPSAGVIVILPQRERTYPWSDLEETYLHELAHVLIGRASGGGEIPRWFHESIAMAVSTPWTFEDRSRTTFAMIRQWNATPADMERWFRGDTGDVGRAYAIGEAFGRDFITRYGILGVRRILERVANGVSFDRAFNEFTGRSPDGAWLKFWDDQTFVSRTIPLISSGTVLWLLITLLALLAFRRRRARDAMFREMWEMEEQMELMRALSDEDEPVN